MRLENKHQNENLDYRKLSIGIKAGQRRQEFKGSPKFLRGYSEFCSPCKASVRNSKGYTLLNSRLNYVQVAQSSFGAEHHLHPDNVRGFYETGLKNAACFNPKFLVALSPDLDNSRCMSRYFSTCSCLTASFVFEDILS